MFTSSLKYICAIFFFITFFVYANSFNNPFIWDDEQFIYANSFIVNFSVADIFTQSTTAGAGVPSTYYRPLTSLSYAIDHYLWGSNPFGFHVKNTLLHYAAGCALLILLANLGLSRMQAVGISLLFLLHPAQVESVAYINSRADSLYALWLFIGLSCFVFFIQKKQPALHIYDLKIQLTTKMALLLAVASYAFSILSKEIGIAGLGLFGLLAVQQVLFLAPKKEKNSLLRAIRRITLLLLPFILVAGMYFLLRWSIVNIPTDLASAWGNESVYSNNVFVRVHTFTRALGEYLRILLVPYPLHMERAIPIMTSNFSIWLVASVLSTVALLAAGWLEYKQKNTTTIFLGAGWFYCMLLPVSGIIPINALLYEHWLYVPMVGFWLVFSGLLSFFDTAHVEAFAKYIGIPALVLYAAFTMRQNYIWGDHVRFYTHTLQYAQTARLHNNLAIALAAEGKYAQAIEQYERSLEISTEYYQTYHNLGNIYLELGNFEQALQAYEQALQLNPSFEPSVQRRAQAMDALRTMQE